MALVVAVLPFLHFYNDLTVSNSETRFWNAIKSTTWFFFLAASLILIGAFLPTKIKTNNGNDPDHQEFIIKFNQIQDAVNLVITFITCAGFINLIFYTASGIISWPLGLVLGNSKLSKRISEINERKNELTLYISMLRDKRRYGTLSDRESQALTRSESELETLEREEAALTEYSSTWVYKARMLIRPSQIIVGTLTGLLSLLLVCNLVIVNIDRLLNGSGSKDGYLLKKVTLFNPIDYIFIYIHNIMLIGPMPLLLIECFLVVCTISGIRNLGLWLFVTKIFKVKVGRTQPQALIFFCCTIMLAILSCSILFFSIAPTYVTFGSQYYQTKGANSTEVLPCSLDSPSNACLKTRSSTLILAMLSQVWLFGAVFYWMSWLFVLVSFVSLIAYSIRGRRDARHSLLSQSDEDEFED